MSFPRQSAAVPVLSQFVSKGSPRDAGLSQQAGSCFLPGFGAKLRSPSLISFPAALPAPSGKASRPRGRREAAAFLARRGLGPGSPCAKWVYSSAAARVLLQPHRVCLGREHIHRGCRGRRAGQREEKALVCDCGQARPGSEGRKNCGTWSW